MTINQMLGVLVEKKFVNSGTYGQLQAQVCDEGMFSSYYKNKINNSLIKAASGINHEVNQVHLDMSYYISDFQQIQFEFIPKQE